MFPDGCLTANCEFPWLYEYFISLISQTPFGCWPMQSSLVRSDIFLSPTSTRSSVFLSFFRQYFLLQLLSKIHKSQMNSCFIHVSPSLECILPPPHVLCVPSIEGFSSKCLHWRQLVLHFYFLIACIYWYWCRQL